MVILFLRYGFQLLVDHSGFLWQLVDTSHQSDPPETELSAKIQSLPLTKVLANLWSWSPGATLWLPTAPQGQVKGPFRKIPNSSNTDALGQWFNRLKASGLDEMGFSVRQILTSWDWDPEINCFHKVNFIILKTNQVKLSLFLKRHYVTVTT